MDMDLEVDSGVSMDKLDQPYANQSEMLSDGLALIDYYLYLYYSRHQWVGPDSEMKNMLGLVITQEEFEHNLSRDSKQSLLIRITSEERGRIEDESNVVKMRLAKTDKGAFPLVQIIDRFHINDFQLLCLLFIYAREVDERYGKMCSYLQDDITKTYPTPTLCVDLFMPENGQYDEYLTRFGYGSSFNELFDMDYRKDGLLRLRKSVLEFLSSGGAAPPSGMEIFSGSPDQEMVTRFETARALDSLMNEHEEKKAIVISGLPGCGKRFQIQHLCSRLGEGCVFADMDVLEHSPEMAAEACFLSRLLGTYLCLYHFDLIDRGARGDGTDIVPPPANLCAQISRLDIYKDTMFILAREPIHIDLGILSVEVHMEPSDEMERAELFSTFLDDPIVDEAVDPFDLAAKFTFEPREIRNACRQAIGYAHISESTVNERLIHECCYRQVTTRLGRLAVRIKPAHEWDDLVLPDQQKNLLQHACSHIRYQHRIYYDWGFGGKVTYGRGLSILFAGPPGTGKTLCAQIMANELNMQIYKVNISKIFDKYIGETEKNLQAVFNEAKKAHCILFFDECDALFGKRTNNTSDSSGRFANVEVAHLLQQLEDYSGVCIMATNLIQNIDEAFMRRITYVARFPFPDEEARQQIYKRLLPKTAPVSDDIDYPFLAETFNLSGGYIKNIVVSAAFFAAEEGTPIDMRCLLRAAINELRKSDIVVVKERLREYADLLEGF